MTAEEAEIATRKSRNVDIKNLPDSTRRALNVIRCAASDGHFHTSIHLTPVDVVALNMLGYKTAECLGGHIISWGKD